MNKPKLRNPTQGLEWKPSKKKWIEPSKTAQAEANVVVVAREDLKLMPSAVSGQRVEAPPYDCERDEPAFDAAWAEVAAAKARGEIVPPPPLPAGGVRLRGRRT